MLRSDPQPFRSCRPRARAIEAGLLTLLVWCWSVGGSAHAAPLAKRAPQQSEIGSFREEQELLLRQLVRLRQTMELLLVRMESEGSTRTVELLRQALSTLDARENQARTLEEWMKESAGSLESGLVLRAVEQQQAAISDLEAVLKILLDRGSKQDVEKQLANLAEIQVQLEQLTAKEREIERRAQALVEQAKDPALEALAKGLGQLSERQRELARQTRDQARQSQDFEFDWLLRELTGLESRTANDRQNIDQLDPESDARLVAARAALDGARRTEGAASKSAEAAQALADQAQTLRSGGSQAAAQARLAELAKGAAQAAQLAPDGEQRAAAEAVKDALLKAQAALDGLEDSDGEAAAQELDRAAAALAERSQSQGQTAEGRRSQAREALLESSAENASQGAASGDSKRAQDLARAALDDARAAEAARAAAQDPQTVRQQGDLARSATERAQRAIDGALSAAAALRSELERSARDSETASAGLSKVVRELKEQNQKAGQGGPPLDQALEEAAAALDQAANEQAAAKQALGAAGQGQPEQREQAAEAAREANDAARSALESARTSLEQAREAAQSNGQDQAALAPLKARQAELSKALEQLAKSAATGSESNPSAGESSPSGQSQGASPELERALEEAQDRMAKAEAELDQGRGQNASSAQDSAAEALESARAQAEAAQPEPGPSEAAEAKRLAEQQRQLREAILELARLNQEREDAKPAPGLERAAAEAEASADNLEQNQIREGQQDAGQAAEELEQAKRQLEEEERRYQQLRQEEVLVEIGQEAQSLLDEHRQQIETTLELDQRRAPDEAPSRSVRLGLRRVSQIEEQLGQRAAKLANDLLEEGAVVFGEYFRAVETDLAVIARDMGDSGDYQSGERVQSMQLDVADRLMAVIEALKVEMERRNQEKQQQQSGQQQQQQEGQNRLVPDVAELKLLRRMQVDVQQSLDQLARLARGDDPIDPLLLQDVTRFAGRHERLSQLFAQFRGRLGLPDPDAKPAPTEEAPR